MSDGHGTQVQQLKKRSAGALAEFASAEDLIRAATHVRTAGYTRWDCHTPYPVHGLDQAMGVKPTILPFIVLGAGLTGVTVAVLMQWWMNAVDYPLQISGKPMWSVPANVPIMFELMVLFSGVTAFLSVFGLNKLPLFYNPVFSSARFRRVTDDRFFIWIDRRDAKFSDQASVQFLQSTGAAHVEVVEENFYA